MKDPEARNNARRSKEYGAKPLAPDTNELPMMLLKPAMVLPRKGSSVSFVAK